MSRTTGAVTAILPELKMREKCYYLKLFCKKKKKLLEHLPLAMALQETIVTIGPLIRYFELI